MSNKRIVNFTTCVRNSSIYDDRVIKLLIGFVPTEDECESLSMEQLRNTELATREKEHANEIIIYLKDIEANYPGIMFDEPVLAYMGVEYFDGREVPDSRIVVFMWSDNDDGDNPDMHVLNMQYFDATDNNIEFAKKYARGTAVRGVDHIDAFDPEKDARQFAQLMSLCNGLVISD